MIPSPPVPFATRTKGRPSLFRSARDSRDLPLVAFALALFTAIAAHAGALLPRVLGPAGDRPEARASRPGDPAAPAPPSVACEAPGDGGDARGATRC